MACMSIVLHPIHQTDQRFPFHPPLVISGKLLADLFRDIYPRNMWSVDWNESDCLHLYLMKRHKINGGLQSGSQMSYDFLSLGSPEAKVLMRRSR